MESWGKSIQEKETGTGSEVRMRNGEGTIGGWRWVMRVSVRNKLREAVDHMRLTDDDKRS